MLADITDPELIRQTLLFLCNEKELTNLAKRLEILDLLKKEESYSTIQKKLSVSSATVSRIANLSESAIAGRLHKYVSANKWAHSSAARISAFFSRSK